MFIQTTDKDDHKIALSIETIKKVYTTDDESLLGIVYIVGNTFQTVYVKEDMISFVTRLNDLAGG